MDFTPKEQRQIKAAESKMERTLLAVKAAAQALLYSDAIGECGYIEYQRAVRNGFPLDAKFAVEALETLQNNQVSRLGALTDVQSALLYTAVSRWKQTDLKDDAVDALLKDEAKVAHLANHRHSVFHADHIHDQLETSEPFLDPAMHQWVGDLTKALRAALLRWSTDLDGQMVRHVERTGY